MSITREDVIWAYRFFLEREPESLDAIDGWISNSESISQLRNGFLGSSEYREKNPVLAPSMSGFEPAITAQIDTDLSHQENEILFSEVKQTWTHLGEVDPYWAVLSSDQYHHLDNNTIIEKFYASGAIDLSLIKQTLIRNEVFLPNNSTVVEYGCGLGRVTSHLAREFHNVIGIDIASSMLVAANEYMKKNDIENVSFELLGSIQDIKSLPKCDLFFSLIVLQHSPPPIISLVIRSAIESLNPKGIALFQVPTYMKAYDFKASDYISGTTSDLFKPKHKKYDIHAIRQCDLFKLIYSAGGIPLEVIENTMLGHDYPGSMSNTMLIQKI